MFRRILIYIYMILCTLLSSGALHAQTAVPDTAPDALSGSTALADPLLTPGGEKKIILGEKERVFLDPPGVVLTARIDTGAAGSSIHASHLERFVREGREWVRFNLNHDGRTRILERPLERVVLVRQAGAQIPRERPVVKLDIRLGSLSLETSFSLTDRSRMSYALILGRDFLRDRALVDVSSAYLTGSD